MQPMWPLVLYKLILEAILFGHGGNEVLQRNVETRTVTVDPKEPSKKKKAE